MLRLKKIFGLLLFASLMLLKVSAFHVYVHEHESCNTVEDCEICDIVLDNQTSDLDIPSPVTFNECQWVTYNDAILPQSNLFFFDSKQNQLFSRPPPSS